MTGMTMEIQKTVLALSYAPAKSSKEAWAAYVRRRWPTNTQAMCEREWDLTPGRANGLVWANVTLPTIDHILHHPRSGPLLALEIEAIRFGLSIEAFLERTAQQEREAIANERRQFEAREARVAQIEALAAERRSFGGEVAWNPSLPDRRWRGGSRVVAPNVGGRETDD